MNMKTREGIYFGNREIVERYVGNKLVWQKEIVLLSGKMSIYSKNDSEKTIIMEINFDKSFKNPDLEPYNITIKPLHEYKDKVIIKNSYIVINNVKYKDVTIYFNFYSFAHDKSYTFTLQFPTFESYWEVHNYYMKNILETSATLIARKR